MHIIQILKTFWLNEAIEYTPKGPHELYVKLYSLTV